MTRTRSERIPAHLETRKELAEGLAIFRLGIQRDFQFKPGQYARLWLTCKDRSVSREYSIASSPGERSVLEFYINLVEKGNLTCSLWDPKVIRALETGHPDAQLAVSGPAGSFVLDLEDPRDPVFVASGTGLAPFVSMLRYMNEQYLSSPLSFLRRTVHVIHGVSYSENLGYRSEIETLAVESQKKPDRRLKVMYLPTISRPHLDPDWRGLRGRAESLFEESFSPSPDRYGPAAERLADLKQILRPDSHVVYVCGHPGTVDQMVRILSDHGFRPGYDIKAEKYYSTH